MEVILERSKEEVCVRGARGARGNDELLEEQVFFQHERTKST
jgi:hypothetical protein